MSEKLCLCGCGYILTNPAKDYKWGHTRPEKTKKKKLPPSTALAIAGDGLVIDAPEEIDTQVYVAVELSEAHLDRIFSMLRPEEKAFGVIEALSTERE